MANERIPNDPYRPGLGNDNLGQPDNEAQVDPQLQEGPASSSRVALYAVAIAVILGAVFYGLNNSSMKEAETAPPAQTAQQTPPQAPAGMRDVTPKPNSQPGVTTGAAPSHPTAPQAAPKGTEIDRSANKPANGNDNK